jgi:dTDP-4-amino-4,6-dideoxygalactose transaminase
MYIPESQLLNFTDISINGNVQDNSNLLGFCNKTRIDTCGGSSALFLGLKLLSKISSRNIWLPAYLCNTVLKTFETLDLDISFYDINKDLEPELDSLNIDSKDILLIVHYFGIMQPINKIKSYCFNRNIFLVEDCAHILPDLNINFQNRAGTFGDISIFSLRKQLPVQDGGLLVVNTNNIDLPGNSCSNKIVNIKKITLQIVENFFFIIGFINIHPLKIRLKKYFSKAGEYAESNNKNYGLSYLSSFLLKHLCIKTNIQKKKENYKFLLGRIHDGKGVRVPFKNLPVGSVPQYFPIYINDLELKTLLQKKMLAKGIGVGSWPGKEKIKQVEFSKYPGSEDWIKRNILIPVHEGLNKKNLIYIEKILNELLDNFENKKHDQT